MIVNKTKKKTLTAKATPKRTIIGRATGLMFRKKLNNEGYVFLMPYKSRWDLTNLFVFQTIDILWLDEKKKVIKASTATPFTFCMRGINKTQFVIELPEGTIEKTKTATGDLVEWKF